jgi:putative toxin-antitoxin system antitoxin component (TIGR02293 family)
MKPYKQPEEEYMDDLPAVNDAISIYAYASNPNRDNQFIHTLSNMSFLNEEILSNWLNITTKTFRNYKNNPAIILKGNIREHLVMLLSLYKHGKDVFGNIETFERWLSSPNPLLGQKKPLSFLDTTSGIQWIDNRLTAMEYGENA